MIRVSHLSKKFGRANALDDVSFHIKPGERVLLVGPNGAGKTTLLRIIAGTACPTSGEVLIPGDLQQHRRRSHARLVGYVGHQSMLYQDLTIEENLRFFGALYDLSHKDAVSRAARLIDMVNMARYSTTPVKELSQGQSKRISIARALIHDPPILLLDEPFSALDSGARTWLGAMLAETPGKTIFLATHLPEQDFPSASRVLLLVGGRLAADEPSIAQLDCQLLRTDVPGSN